MYVSTCCALGFIAPFRRLEGQRPGRVRGQEMIKSYMQCGSQCRVVTETPIAKGPRPWPKCGFSILGPSLKSQLRQTTQNRGCERLRGFNRDHVTRAFDRREFGVPNASTGYRSAIKR